MSKKIVFSGIQPSGNLHIGNYIGAVRRWAEGQKEGTNIFCIVDLHAITMPQEPKSLQEKTLELAALLLAAGIDPERSLLFVQSHNPDHANLGWVLNCYLSMGQLNRMTQYKEKSADHEFVSVGLFDYPALMAADILLYDTTEVPVGEDQKQHVELTRDVAERFNSKYGETFVLPKPIIPEYGSRIMSLLDPTKKMSKSDANPMGAIGLLDSEEQIRKKILGAVTDSGTDIKYDLSRPGVSNLLEIYSNLSGQSLAEIENKFAKAGYREFKEDLANLVCGELLPLQARYTQLRESGELEKVLRRGAERAYALSHPKLLKVYDRVGFVKS